MLEEGGCIGLDRVQAIVQHSNDLRQLRLSPRCGRSLPQGAVQRRHASPLHCHGNTPCVRVNSSHVTVQSIFTAPAHCRKASFGTISLIFVSYDGTVMLLYFTEVFVYPSHQAQVLGVAWYHILLGVWVEDPCHSRHIPHCAGHLQDHRDLGHTASLMLSPGPSCLG